jgi:hypothetical protein
VVEVVVVDHQVGVDPETVIHLATVPIHRLLVTLTTHIREQEDLQLIRERVEGAFGFVL